MIPAAPTGPQPAPTAPTSVQDLGRAWSEAREDAAQAYAAWCRASRDGRREAYAVFVAAVDREDAAERGYLAARATT